MIKLGDTVRAVLICLCFARTSVSMRTRPRRILATPRGFPWHFPSCSLGGLSSEDVKDVVNWKQSSSGNSGGVHFFALARECLLVVKPKVDLHDLFALELGAQLGVPVVPSRAVAEADPLFDALIEGIYNGAQAVFKSYLADNDNDEENIMALSAEPETLVLAQDVRDSFAKEIKESGAVQLLEVAPGKDLYEFTKGFDFRACDACADDVANDIIAKDLDLAPERIIGIVLQQVAEKRVTPFYEPMVDEVKLNQSLDDDSPLLPEAVHSWMLEHPADKRNPLNKLRKTKRRKLKTELANARKCEDRNGAKKQTPPMLDSVSAFIEDSIASDKTMDQLAQLSAYASLIGENDGAPTFDAPVSNMHNVFVSPSGATGIDMAVGGALTHSSIRSDGSGGQPVHNWTPYFLNALLQARVCSRGMDLAGAEPFEYHLGIKLQMPYFNGDIHKHALECQIQNGRAISNVSAGHAAKQIAARIPAKLADFIEVTEQAINRTSQKLATLGSPSEMRDIIGWLMKRVVKLREFKNRALLTCQVDFNKDTRGQDKKSVPEAFERHGRQVQERVQKCADLRIDRGLGMCCVTACHYSEVSRLKCLKKCQDLMTQH